MLQNLMLFKPIQDLLLIKLVDHFFILVRLLLILHMPTKTKIFSILS